MWGWCMDWVGRVLDCFILLKILKYPLVSLLWGNGWWFSCEDVIAYAQVDRTYITYPNFDRDSTIILWSGKSLFQIGGTNSKGHVPIERKPLREYLQALSETCLLKDVLHIRQGTQIEQFYGATPQHPSTTKWNGAFPSLPEPAKSQSPHRHPATKQVRGWVIWRSAGLMDVAGSTMFYKCTIVTWKRTHHWLLALGWANRVQLCMGDCWPAGDVETLSELSEAPTENVSRCAGGLWKFCCRLQSPDTTSRYL